MNRIELMTPRLRRVAAQALRKARRSGWPKRLIDHTNQFSGIISHREFCLSCAAGQLYHAASQDDHAAPMLLHVRDALLAAREAK